MFLFQLDSQVFKTREKNVPQNVIDVLPILGYADRLKEIDMKINNIIKNFDVKNPIQQTKEIETLEKEKKTLLASMGMEVINLLSGQKTGIPNILTNLTDPKREVPEEKIIGEYLSKESERTPLKKRSIKEILETTPKRQAGDKEKPQE